jgi:hypothetical protein
MTQVNYRAEVVRFVTDAEGCHWAAEKVVALGNCTIPVWSP